MELPRRFGKYELAERLATGGMAEVFLARSFGLQGFQKQLVIKRILPALANEPRFVSMFIKEAKITAGLTHPNIVQIFELGRVNADHYIAMEFIHGRDIARITRQLRRREQRLPLPLAVYVIANLMRGLAYAHALTDASGASLHLVHRDISPHNVLISFQGEVKLLDFGIARLASAEQQRRTGRVGGGKYAYMSPEQAKGDPLDARSDLFSAGIVLYELLSGGRLFQHPDPEEKLRLVREAVVPDIRERNPDVPQRLWDILRRLLAADPADRYDRAEAVEEDLWAFLFSVGWRADAAALQSFMRGLFPDAAARRGARVDLAGLAEDLGRIDSPSSSDVPSMEGSEVDGLSLTGATGSGTRTPPQLKPGERRTVSVLVAELCGLTELSESRDPSEIVRHHYQLLRRIRRIVDKYGGLLESFRDDELIIFFGMRKTRESDLERALGCALRLQQRFRGSGIALAMGVHVGEITVGSRSGRSWRYLARGDTMKLSRRLSIEADLNETLVSPEVADRVEGLYRFARGPSFRLKGQPDKRTALKLLRKRRQAAGGEGRWLRRGGELEVLTEGLRALEAGEGGLVAVVGEGGVGKSRLLSEVARLARTRGVPFFSSRAAAYERDTPLAPFRDLVSSVIGAEPDAGRRDLRAQLKRLSQLRIDDTDRAVIGQLFGLRTRHKVEPDDVQRAAAVLVRRLAEDQPVILAMDDAHHLDPRAATLIRHVVDACAGAPVLFLVASREPLPAPLASPRWRIDMSPLSAPLQRQMAADVLGVREIAPALAEKLAEASRGNPLYLSLVLKSLLRDDRLKRDDQRAALHDTQHQLALPPGMDGLISARVDALDETSRRFLQLAAIVGVSFPVSLITEAGHFSPEAIGGILERLAQQSLIEAPSEGRCSFASPMLWEGVRRSIVASRLRQLHALIVEGVERLYGEDLGPHRAALAHHCAAAGRLVDASRHALYTGRRFRSQHLLREAADSWMSGIRWIEDAQRSGAEPAAAQALAGQLWLSYGRVSAVLSEHSDAERWLTLAQELGSEAADAELEAKASLELGRMYRELGRHVLAKAHLESALQASYASTMTAQSGPIAWRVRVAVEALEALGMMEQEQGDTDAAARRFQLAFHIAGDDDELAARAMMGLAVRHVRYGETPEALSLLHDARRRAEASNDRILLGRVINAVGIAHFYATNYDEALVQFRRSVEIRQNVGYRSGVVVNYHNIGDAYLRKDDLGRAWAAFQRSRDLALAMGWSFGEVMNEPFVAFIEGLPKDGEDDHARAAARARMEAAVAHIEALSDVELSVSARWLQGRLLAAHGDHGGAKAALEAALAAAKEVDARPLIRDINASMAAVDGGPDSV